MAILRLFICLILVSNLFLNKSISAGELIITGVYLGKNIYIQNTRTSEIENFCTEKVFLNDKLIIQNPTTSTFMIDLSDLIKNEPVKITIIYSNHCIPIVINPQVIKAKKIFDFQNVFLDESGLSWFIKGEQGEMRYFIEKRINNKWIIVQSVEGKGFESKNIYSVTLSHTAGLNQYRIKGIFDSGEVFYSSIIRYESGENTVSFYPVRVTNKITFSRKAMYEVLDVKGNILAKGKEKEISVENLSPGLYYLVLDNQIEKFIKK